MTPYHLSCECLGTEIPGHRQEQLWQALIVGLLAHFYSDHWILKSVKIVLLTRPGLVLWMVQGKGGGQKHKDFVELKNCVELKPKNSIAGISQTGECLKSATLKAVINPAKKNS